MKKRIISILITLVFAFVLFYLMLPAINLSNPGFYAYLCIVLMFYFVACNISFDNVQLISNRKKINHLVKDGWVLILIFVIFIGIMFINFICSPVFNAKNYSERITVLEGGEFTSEVDEVDFNRIPLLDKDSSRKLGDRKMGEMSEWVSQFDVSSLYTQINYNDTIVRVTPIEYASFIKWITNRKEGIKGYISVNSVTGDSSLFNLDKGIKYTSSAYFNDDLMRKVRFMYPTKIFGDVNFEVDEEGNPYWIISTLKYSAVGLRADVSGVIVFNGITGESDYYKVGEVPGWIDHVYSADMIIEQVDNWGEYRNGFINSIFGQKNVVNTTDGYNYLALHDDIYLYTGITSVSADESNLGFILTNLRTKETNFYSVPGAEEYSAMSSAEGLVQEKGYDASFPLLINLKGNPTYLLSLKDNAGLVKMYSFVDVVDYQKVTTSDVSVGIEGAAQKFIDEYLENKVVTDILEATIKIKSIKDVIIDGNTYYYIVSNDGSKYSVCIDVDKNNLPFLNVGDTVNVDYISKDGINNIVRIN